MPKKYDLVAAKQIIKLARGRMNTYDQSYTFKAFDGYGIVLGASNNFVQIYLPNREKKLLKHNEIVVVNKI